jgi:hypothetical protein
MKPPWVGSGCKVSNAATGLLATGVANSPIRRRLSEVTSSIASRFDGSSVDEVISIKEVVLEKPSSRNYESVFWFLLLEPNPKLRYDFGLLK